MRHHRALSVLIAPDKFKGTLPARDVARAIARGWRSARPGDRIQVLPITDGGDGFGEVMAGLLGGRPRRARTVDARHRGCMSRWWWAETAQTAIVESARVIGLAMLPAGRFHPFELDTTGLGLMLQTLARKLPRRCLIGIGGSATNDGGFGLARALGWEFLGPREAPIARWTDLQALRAIKPPRQRLDLGEVLVAVDVRNTLLGPLGATRVYGPQKGLRPPEFLQAERCLSRLADVVAQSTGRDLAKCPGSGAAGGLGFGLMAFLEARLESGFELFSRYALLERRLQGVNLILTGEGRLDRSTLMGKGVGQLARVCRATGVDCLGLGGAVDPHAGLGRLFAEIRSLTDLTSRFQARTRPAHWLERLAAQAALAWGESPKLKAKS